ncbi:hypothetical protein OEA41_003611 [Lepraria neglecta]|uniref:RING-type domain-containing protein n=1 Tax=Lepraria neglecta TaxID=209136 RepID=A0AAD9Z7B1_9LECA|nr:hypothetical protein OEA41_003611 [Lepraria neglecta]
MAPSPSRQLEQILNKTRQPLLSELDSDLKCHICHDSFLSGKEPEILIKLPCGHTYGQSCILEWLSPLSKEGKNSWSMCRKAIIDNWDRDFKDEVLEQVGGTRVEAPATRPRIRVTGPVPTQQARLRAAFAQSYEQAYEQARGATAEEAASDLEAMDITMEREREQEREHLQRAGDEQNRRLWIQFCEGVVRIVEGSGYLNTSERLPVARLILRIDSFEGFLRLRAEDPVTHHRVLSTFPRLHTELLETETQDNIFTSTSPRDLIVFQMNRQRWTEASPSLRARIIEALATRIEVAIQELGNEQNHVQVRASLGPEPSAPLVH